MHEDLEICSDNSAAARIVSRLERHFDKTAALTQRAERADTLRNRSVTAYMMFSDETSHVNHASQSVHSDSRSHESGDGL